MSTSTVTLENILDSSVLTENVENNNWQAVLRMMRDVSKALSVHDNRKLVTLPVLQAMAEVMNVAVSKIDQKSIDINLTVVETFRALRNSCVGEEETQNSLVKNTSVLDDTCSMLNILASLPEEDTYVSCIRTGVQFLGNLVVNNTENQKEVWMKCSTVLMKLLKYKDEKVVNYSSMVVYNILLGCPDLSLEQGTQILEALIDHAMMDSEFALYAVELMLGREGYLETVYNKLGGDRRLFLLEVAHSMISSRGEKTTSVMSVTSINFLAQQFKLHSDCILKTVDQYVEKLEPVEVSKLLELIASASSSSPYLEKLQEDRSLLINCSFLLRSIHTLGKTGENSFSAVQKLSELSLTDGQKEIQQHPAFGFKGGLIRLLGNLCWKNRENQDQIRDLDCIPVLLDCCNIDARNPLIIQWVVLAVRNLCEGNASNQALIASMTHEGVVDSSVLREFGITLHEDSEKKIGIVPLPR